MTLTAHEIKLVIDSVEIERSYLRLDEADDCPRYKALTIIISKLEKLLEETESKYKALDEILNREG